ncbi:MAG: DUF2332 domain-containing protein [Gaiellales bacterium]
MAGGRGSSSVALRLKPYLKVAAFRLPSSRVRRRMLVRHLHRNAATSASMGSDLYRTLLLRVANDVGAAGPCWNVFSSYRPTGPVLDDGVGFRFMAAVHRLVLAGRAPALAEHYPSAGGQLGSDPWPAFLDVVRANGGEIRELMKHGLQTNEVGRCRAFIGGFLAVAQETGLPLRLLEVGSSAGLNLRWDHYRYELGGETWGDPTSPVRIVDGFDGGTPSLRAEAVVASRNGCDLAPIDPTDDDDRLWLRASLWPDQVERQARLAGALDIAARVPVTIEQADAATWLRRMLSERADGTATVIYHSIVMRYLTEAGRAEVRQLIEDAGARADAGAPLAWLQIEGGGTQEIRLQVWPGGESRLLGKCDPQAQHVRWHAER